MPKNHKIIVGPQFPAIGGIATIVELLKKEFKDDETYYFINTIKPSSKRARFLRPFRLLMQLFLVAKRNKGGTALMFSSAYNSFWEKCIWCYVLKFFGTHTIVVMVHGEFPEFYDKLPYFAKYLSRQLVKNIDTLAAQSPTWHKYYKTIFPNANIQVINPGINTDFFIPTQQKKDNQPIKLLYTGWIIKKKGIYDLLDALAILSKKNVHYKLSIIGPDFGNKNSVEKYALKLKINSHIEFIGILDTQLALLENYQNADIFICPSHFEGFPYALMEATACGLPCVGTRVGGIPDILNNGKNGILINPSNPTELAEGIEKLIINEDYRKEIGLLSRTHIVNNHSIAKSISDFNLFLNSKDEFRRNKQKHQICSNCVRDTADAKIIFDEKGVCDHCNDFYKNVLPYWHTDGKEKEALEKIVSQIKKEGKGKDFDCILGMSGGVDSSYLLHLAVTELGLRPLVFHVDGGWNSELAVHNIQVMVDQLGLDLYTEVINWEEMKDFQLAFLKSGVPHIDIPQDHAFIATLYNFANKHNIKYILNGGNISTEAIENPMEWLYYGTDMSQIKDIINRFGTIKMETYPFSPIFKHKFYLRYIKRVQVVKPLNYMPYIKEDALKLLANTYTWKPYPQKHFESRFTKFFEGYWLPERFGFDTRRVQYSNLILTKQMTRNEALERLKKTAYDPATIDDEFNYIATKLGITSEKLKEYFKMEKKFYWDYKNQVSLFVLGAKVLKFLGIERSIKR